MRRALAVAAVLLPVMAAAAFLVTRGGDDIPGAAGAFAVLFDNDRTDEERIAVLEDGDALAELFHRFAANGPNRAQATISARDVAEDGDIASGLLSVLNGNPPADPAIHAVRIDGRWLVTTDTYCRLLTDGGVDLRGTPCEGPLVSDPGPLDPSTAEREGEIIAATIDDFIGGRAPDAVENSEEFEVIRDDIAAAGQNFDVSGASTRSIRFRSGHEADVTFDVRTSTGGVLVTRDGTLLKVDGRWVLSRETFCDLIAGAGVTCPPAGRP